MGVGNFDNIIFENFEDFKSHNLLWVFYLVSAFLCNIVFLNMLIAIMGDTFHKIISN